jgi:hypothetical protein
MVIPEAFLEKTDRELTHPRLLPAIEVAYTKVGVVLERDRNFVSGSSAAISMGDARRLAIVMPNGKSVRSMRGILLRRNNV